jgi:hypothetical protein
MSIIQLLYTVEEKGGKPDRKPYPLPYGLRNPYRDLKYENSEDYAQKPQQDCMFMNSASGVSKLTATAVNLCFIYRIITITKCAAYIGIGGMKIEDEPRH